MLSKDLIITMPGGGDSNAKIHFIASKDFINVNFFQNVDTKGSYDFSYLQVYINDTLTEQEANSISANADDDIKIISTTNKYPWFGQYSGSSDSIYNIDYIKSIEEPLPLMVDSDDKPITSYRLGFYWCSSLVSIPEGLFDNNHEITDFMDCFSRCSLTSIPKGLFDNNPLVTDFGHCFSYTNITSIPEGLFNNNTLVTDFDTCFGYTDITSIPEGLFDNSRSATNFHCCFGYTDITSIPEGLFDNSRSATNFNYCFEGCKSLISVPYDLFANNMQVTNFDGCFGSCSNLIVNVQIGSTASEVIVDNFAVRTKEKGTVYCRAGSAAYQSFSTSTTANVNVLTY